MKLLSSFSYKFRFSQKKDVIIMTTLYFGNCRVICTKNNRKH